MKSKKLIFHTIEIFVVLNILLLLFISSAFAKTYYVDKTNGSDSNSGTINSPWEHCPGLTGWSGSLSLSFGDTIKFNNTDIWNCKGGNNCLIALKGGITYDGSSWGAGTRAKFSALGKLSRSVVWINADNITFKGFEVDGANYDHSGVTISYPYGGTEDVDNVILDNLAVHDCGSASTPWDTYCYGIVLGAIGGNITRNVTLTNSKIYNTSDSNIAVYPSNDSNSNQIINVTVRGCVTHNAGEKTGNAGYGILLKNHSQNAIIEFNEVSNADIAGIDLESHGSTFSGPSNAVVRYNIIRNSRYGIQFQGTGNRSAVIYGNIVYSNDSYGIVFMYNIRGELDIKIYNNTIFYNCLKNNNSEIVLGNGSFLFNTFELKNNIIYARNGTYCYYDQYGGKLTSHDYNIYWEENGDGNLINNGGTIYYSKNLSSWETNSYGSNPNFKDKSNPPTGFSGSYGIDLKPNNDNLSTESNNAIENGVNLGPNYNGAINLSGKGEGLIRPKDEGWTIGAYESRISNLLFNPPTRLRATILW